MGYESVILDEMNHGGLPIAYWALDEVNGTAAADLMVRARSTGYPGVYAGGYTLDQRPGPINRDSGGSPLFDGSTGRIDVNGASLSALNGSFMTVMAWVWIDASQTNGYPRILDRAYAGQFSFYYRAVDPLCLGFALKATTGAADQSRMLADPVVNAWSFVAATWDGTTITLWNNTNTATYSNVALSGGLANSSANIRIGQRVDAGDSRAFKGKIAHVELYNYVVSEARIHAHYLAGLNGTAIQQLLMG